MSEPLVLGGKTASDYQVRAVEAVERADRSGRKAGMVVAPTASGKSLVIAMTARSALERGRTVVVIQPNEDLLRQNLEEIAGIEAVRKGKASIGLLTDASKTDFRPKGMGRNVPHSTQARIVLATQATFAMLLNRPQDYENLLSIAPDTLYLIDEGEAAGAERFSQRLAEMAAAGAAGVLYTATAFRTDGIDPLIAFSGSEGRDEDAILADIGILEVLEAGRIVKPKLRSREDKFLDDLGAEHAEVLQRALLENGIDDDARAEAAGDRALDALMKTPEGRDAFARGVETAWRDEVLADAAARKLTMIHCRSVDSAEAIAKRIGGKDSRLGGKGKRSRPAAVGIATSRAGAFLISEGRRTPIEREEILEMSRNGKVDVLVNCRAFGRGTNVPRVDAQILAFPFRCPRDAVQNIGRGLRIHAGKDDCLVVDLGSTLRHMAQDSFFESAGTKWRDKASSFRASMPESAKRHVDDLLGLDPEFMETEREAWLRVRGASDRKAERLLAGRGENQAGLRTVPLARGVWAFGRSSGRERGPELAVACDAVAAGLAHPKAGPVFLCAIAGRDPSGSFLSGWAGSDLEWAKTLASRFVAPLTAEEIKSAEKAAERSGTPKFDPRLEAEIKADGLFRSIASVSAETGNAWKALKEPLRAAVGGALFAAAFGEAAREAMETKVLSNGRRFPRRMALDRPDKLSDRELALALAWAGSLADSIQDGRAKPFVVAVSGVSEGEREAASLRLLALRPPHCAAGRFKVQFVEAVAKTNPSGLLGMAGAIEAGEVPTLPKKAGVEIAASCRVAAENAAGQRI